AILSIPEGVIIEMIGSGGNAGRLPRPGWPLAQADDDG
ncbi:MAG TPA: catechol 1,2-dioxygenase, partial [Rhodospirillaceae bacterium]|nr:catechol 1,2-dioxygenase [Rhodospirillaceae bacterium]